MTQIATVERIINAGYAEISVARKSACGHDCEECAGCGVSGAAVHARATNGIGAQPGQKVVVRSDTSKMMKVIGFVYTLPIILFLLGYIVPMALELPGAVSLCLGLAGFLVSIAAAIVYDRRLRARGGLTFEIVRLF